MSWESFVLSRFLEKTSMKQELVAPQMFSKLTHKNILTRFVFVGGGGLNYHFNFFKLNVYSSSHVNFEIL